ncbi:DEAD/DEAH box helicase [Opitutus sp. ER46]|uniref:DEAD/DEAH box helicase n=1 Tax=Opitutus sp. ER46 TaxID=2161864 RepID=UPI000D3136EE|nr:DEAD/DEAH box helicase [Opitutus sp. ER46]PTX94309.1 helicase [Opitutus sp. ER46]
MFTWVREPAHDAPWLLRALHPELATWFRARFGAFAPAQLAAVPEVLARRSLLLSSPTGSGKTLAAFLGVFDYLARAHDAGAARDGIVAVYVSPLRALAYDLSKNLQSPLDELGWSWLRVGARTGDTTVKERAQQRRHPPHILVTTPESLTILLSQPSWLPAFRTVRFFIADELHALAENKRGTMAVLAAERLHEIAATAASSAATDGPGPPGNAAPNALVRIGLSATVTPLETMAAFLVGPERDCRLIEIAERRRARIEVFSPLRDHAYPPAGYTASRVLLELGTLLGSKRTTLIFTNTRSGAEHIGLRLKQLLPALTNQIEVHHASLDRSVRLEVEDRLKRGELRAVVCSTSLEMGIDIGSIDTVVMVSAPKGVARALQRIGRSGHSMRESPHGVLVASNINDLAECAVTARMMEGRALEPVRIHDAPLDVLAQTLVSLAVFGSVTSEEAFAFLRRTYPYRALARADFDRVLRYLRGGGAALEANYEALFGKVRVDALGLLTLPAPRVAREFFQNVGTIATESMVQVQLGRRKIGQVEESFIKGLRVGDVFVLNGRTLRLLETRLLTAKVAAADSAVPTVPRWYANKMPLASGLAAAVVQLRTELAARLTTGTPATPRSHSIAAAAPQAPDQTDPPAAAVAAHWLQSEYALSAANARALVEHFALQARVSAIPTAATFLIERYDHRGLIHYFFHALIGRSANDAVSRIIAQRVQETKGGNALVTIDDYGFLLTLKPFQAMTPDEWRSLFRREDAESALRTALAESSLVKWQFRGVAQTGLMVPRRVRGQERGARALQWSSEIIFEVLRRHEPDHPLLVEAYAEATLRFLDLPRALAFLEKVADLRWDFRTLPRVSPFSFGIYVSRIRETMTLEDPETTIERLYHEMYGTGAG